MKLSDPNRDYRPLVQGTYDQIASEFNRTRITESPVELAPLLSVLGPGSTVLDLGCGSGVPIANALAGSHNVIGVDLSAGQLANALAQVPGASFLQADMSRCQFRPGSFDAVVSFYAIFHLPVSDHASLIARIGEWLKSDGYFLVTLSPHRQEGYTEDDFFGAEMFWSNLSLPEYRDTLGSSGFEILSEAVVGHGYTDEDANPEQHPLVFARRR
jgi:cyclopropane fatty-acyl-phospholipid synthase-like methyltransferase